MTWYLHHPQPAVNIEGSLVPAGSGNVYALDDIGFVTPLTVRDPVTLVTGTVVTVTDFVSEAFEVEDNPEVYWKSGAAPAMIRSSVGGMRDATLAAQAAAEAAEVAASASAASVAVEVSQAEAAAEAAQTAQTNVEATVGVMWLIVAPGVNGVVGDGVTDDTAAIQAIIDTAVPGQGIWFAATGSAAWYAITDTLTVTTANLRFIGQPRDVYATSIRCATPGIPMIEVKAPGFVFQDMNLWGDSAAGNGVGATVTGLDLYGDVDGNIDAHIVDSTFMGCAIAIHVRARNTAIEGCLVSNSLKGVVLDGIDAVYHTGPGADQNRGNVISDNRFHNIGVAATDACIEITDTAKILHAKITDNYFDSSGLGSHILATGTSGNPHQKLTMRGNKHAECSAEPYNLTYVQNSTIEGADIAGYTVGTPPAYHAVKLTNCDTIAVDSVMAIQVTGSGVYARSTARVFVRDSVFRVLGFGASATGHGLDVDATCSASRFDRVTVETADGWGFTGEPTTSSMTDCAFTSCALGRVNSQTVVNRGQSGRVSFVDGLGGFHDSVGSKVFDLPTTTKTAVATAVCAGGSGVAYRTFALDITFTARGGDGAGGSTYAFARRYVRLANGSPVITTIGTDDALSTSGVTVSLTAANAVSGTVVVRAWAPGAASNPLATYQSEVTLAMS